MLPITETGEINYEFMENYMKCLEAKMITKYLLKVIRGIKYED